jgi:hypothetical protein
MPPILIIGVWTGSASRDDEIGYSQSCDASLQFDVLDAVCRSSGPNSLGPS